MLARLEGSALLVDLEPLAAEMAAIEAATGYEVPLWVEAMATGRLTGATLIISHRNFSGRMPARFRPAAAGAGVEFRVVDV